MKVSKKFMHAAAVYSSIELNSMKDLADNVAEHLNGAEVHETKSDGFTLRLKKNHDLDYRELTGVIMNSICELLDNDLENSMDYIMENYEFVYNSNQFDADHAKDLFHYSQDGRLLYVEIDL